MRKDKVILITAGRTLDRTIDEILTKSDSGRRNLTGMDKRYIQDCDCRMTFLFKRGRLTNID